MFDLFNRQINYLRISVTDRCNLRCRYCMPEEGVSSISHAEILSFDEIKEVSQTAVDMGVTKIRITGGEPLVRKGIVTLVKNLSQIKGIKDLAMTTNGILLEEFAPALRQAGLQRINISLDSVNSEQYRYITRCGDLSKVLRGIEAARKSGLQPIKINCVIKSSNTEAEALQVARFCEVEGLEIRYIREMSLEHGEFWSVQGGDGGNCSICNRLRLTANGKIKPCLFSNLEFDVRELGSKTAIIEAVKAKPRCGTANIINHFNNIGG